MLEKLRGINHWRKSPAIMIVGVVLVIVIIAGTVLLLTKSNSTAEAAVQPAAARIDQVDGSVGIARVKADDQQLDWTEATVNTPVTVGDRIYSRESAKAAIALTGRNYVRLNPETTIDVLTLAEHRTQLALRDGSGLFDVGALSGDDFFEVATPCGAVDFREPGLYQIGMDGDNAIISVLSGAAQVVGLGGSGYISKGEVYTLFAQDTSEAASATFAPDVAGEIVDDYYRERYPKVYDGRYRSYDAYLADPYFYDPYRTSVSCQYVGADVPGLYDLDYYGDWADLSGYGQCWAPRVSAGWAPFRNGYWDLDDLWGPTWVSSEPWGWAPYHYGRWTFISQRWYWVPVEVRRHPAYCPAPVTFISFQDQIAWVPLGPGEVYVPRYYDDGLRPRFLASREVINVVSARNTFVNFDAPGGVTVVPIRGLNRVIDPASVANVDLNALKQGRQVIDPFSVEGVREVALRRGDARRRLRLARGDNNEAFGRQVVTSNTPEAFRVRSDMAKALRVEPVHDNQRKNKLKVEQTGVVNSIRADGLPRPALNGSQRMSELASRAEHGDKSARRELRQMMREEQRSGGQPQAGQPATQAPNAGHQQQNLSRKELRLQRKAEQPQPQQEQMREQRRAQQQSQQDQARQLRKAGRQQAAQQDAARQAQQQQMKQQQQQMKQQRRVERQQRIPQPQQPRQPQTRQQRKEQKRKPPETAVQQQQLRHIQRAQQQAAARQSQAGLQREQMKAQKRAERQSAVMTQQRVFRAQESQRQQQQQAARAQAAQRGAMMQQAARARESQRQAVIQPQAARVRESQRQAVIQPQAARSQAAQRAARPPVQQQFPNPQVQQSRGAQKAQRRPPQ